MIIGCHQPNFTPWVPFFEKIEQSDIFVIMGNCQFEKNNFQNRFNVNNKWHTMRVFSGMTTLIKDKKYISPEEDWQKITKAFPKLSMFDSCISENLLSTNSFIIKEACRHLKINTKITLDYKTDLKGTERLLDICKTNGATKYLSGVSGKNYLDVSLFEKAGIEVIFQESKNKIPLIELL